MERAGTHSPRKAREPFVEFDTEAVEGHGDQVIVADQHGQLDELFRVVPLSQRRPGAVGEHRAHVQPEGFLVPAHVWTPWFSLFGSRSGFDSIEECFGDLTSHVFALETGLSSDPEMNRLISSLDRLALISNSDCHSPARLGREANLFATGFDFYSLRDAIRNNRRDTFPGTIEFFPEEGKYHADGHRQCRVCLDPHETRRLGLICPVCDQP